jgi:hypothetical protein
LGRDAPSQSLRRPMRVFSFFSSSWREPRPPWMERRIAVRGEGGCKEREGKKEQRGHPAVDVHGLRGEREVKRKKERERERKKALPIKLRERKRESLPIKLKERERERKNSEKAPCGRCPCGRPALPCGARHPSCSVAALPDCQEVGETERTKQS